MMEQMHFALLVRYSLWIFLASEAHRFLLRRLGGGEELPATSTLAVSVESSWEGDVGED